MHMHVDSPLDLGSSLQFTYYSHSAIVNTLAVVVQCLRSERRQLHTTGGRERAQLLLILTVVVMEYIMTVLV